MGSISPAAKGCRRHWPKRTSTLGHRDIERVHVSSRTGFPHDRSSAADMVRVTVSKNQVLELILRTASAGVSVWYDEFSLKLGDSLRGSIDFGLANSRYGVVIFSKKFFAKHWPVQELNGLVGREVGGQKIILPIWHDVKAEEVREFSPILADRIAVQSSEGMEKLVQEIIHALENG
jgi:hypothetical protein